MKIKVIDNSDNGEVFVWGVWGPKTINHILTKLNEDIQRINRSLRELADE